jgi:hypothetical protein
MFETTSSFVFEIILGPTLLMEVTVVRNITNCLICTDGKYVQSQMLVEDWLNQLFPFKQLKLDFT